MSHVHVICATRGKYSKPIPLLEAGIRWIDDNDEPTTPPNKAACRHPKHWEWGTGTRNGQKLNYPLSELFYQKWHLTKKEMSAAIKEYDMASLDVPSRIICKNCLEKLNQIK